MDELLTPISTTYTRRNDTQSLIVEPVEKNACPSGKEPVKISSPEEALEILRNQPEYDALVTVLKYLIPRPSDPDEFNISRPSPQSARIIQVLVTDIAQNYWTLLKEDAASDADRLGSSVLNLFFGCLHNITGLNAILLQLKLAIGLAKTGKSEGKHENGPINIRTILEILCAFLEGYSRVRCIWTAVTSSPEILKARMIAREFVFLIGSGKVTSYAAEAEDLLEQASHEPSRKGQFWVANSSRYNTWIVQNITSWMKQDFSEESTRICRDILAQSIRLGHFDQSIKLLIQSLLLGEVAEPDTLRRLVKDMSPNDFRKVLHELLKFLSGTYLDPLETCTSDAAKAKISAAANVISITTEGNRLGTDYLATWLTSSSGAGVGEGVGIRRAVMAVISQSNDLTVSVFQQTLAQFGDALYIKHSSMLQQDAHAQVLLLSAGCLHHADSFKMGKSMRSSVWLRAISNRLGASQHRARFLGMVVGEAISSLIEKGEKKLDFHMEETGTEEGRWYKSLVEVTDQIGPLEPLRTPSTGATSNSPQKRPQKPEHFVASGTRQRRKPPAKMPPQQGFIIEEVLDDGEDKGEEDDEGEDEDAKFALYAKSDSDPEDSDDDPTLIRRNKPKAPVYIRNLILYLRDTENYDCQKLALTTAPTLIRRKANYGSEVSEHAEELARLLVGLQDKYEMEDFYNLRLQGMIALTVSQSAKMGPWFAKTFFDGDYSTAQRSTILAVLGLSARELAGVETSEYSEAASFPSKRLPYQTQQRYLEPGSDLDSSSSNLKALPPNALEDVVQSLTLSILAPMAARAADAATGPDALKLSSFTSRLQAHNAQVKSKSKSKPQIRNIPNKTAQLLSSSFFSPLTARFQAALQSPISRTRGIIFQPHLLSLYLKTLAMILHAAGPSTLSLPQTTAEMWGLLLSSSIRAQCAGDLAVTGAVMFALLALLDVNEDRMRDLCQDMGRELVETQEWVSTMYHGIRGSDGVGSREENEVKILAAGVLIRLQGGFDKYQRLLMGGMIGIG